MVTGLRRWVKLGFLGLVCLATAGLAAEPRNLCDTVKPSAAYPGALRASDVCIRSLVPRPINAKDPYDTLQAIRDFHATRLEWTYGLTPPFVAKVKALGVTASGACANMSTLGIDTKVPEWYKRYSALDLDGNAIEAPWMRDWPGHALWHCVNNPDAREAYLRYVKAQLDVGSTDLQRDDPTMNLNATNWGGCFCPYCVKGFREYLQAHGDPAKLTAAGVGELATFDYAAYLRAKQAPVGDAFGRYPQDYLKGEFIRYQEQSTIEFHQWWRQELNAYAGRYVPVSSNNGVSDYGPIHSLFDYWIGELNWPHAQPEALWEAARVARERGKGQTTTMPLRGDAVETPEWIRRVRQTIATTYALGMHIEAPWDTYLPILGETPARYFGKPADYADLFALVRASASLLDGYEEAAVIGGALDDQRWTTATAPLHVFGRRVHAFTRALPGQPEAPVVAHLVDWSASPQPCTVSLNPDALFAGRPLRVSLIAPRPYDAAAHARAFETKDYAPLVQETVLAEGKVTTVEVPALQPWGLLVLRPLPAKAGPWPPRFLLAESKGQAVLTLSSPDRNAVIRFTTDGSAPGRTSLIYRDPLPLGSSTALRARSYLGNAASAESVLAHPPAAGQGPRELLVNGDFAGGSTGWTPVTMDPLKAADLEFTVGPVSKLGDIPGARLVIKQSDGVAYHLRLTQPVTVKAGATLNLTTTLVADRPTRIRLGVQERREPFRGVAVRIFEIGPEPTVIRMSLSNAHPELQAQYQLDLGYAEAGTTVWVAGARLRELDGE